MQSEERQKRIREHLERVEFASLEDLARQVSASLSTVRRDLNSLETAGAVRRTHGGARLVSARPDDYIFSKSQTIQLAEKEAIGRECAALIKPGESIIVDAGSTAFHVARQLEGKAMQIITNSLPVANLFASTPNAEVIVSGGVIYPRLGVLVGPVALELFSKTHADVAIMSGGGITLEGITNSHALLIDIQRAMIEAAGRVIFCFDHTKIGRRSVAHLCSLSSVDLVVTDPAAPADLVYDLRNAGVEVLVAGEASPVSQIPAPATSASDAIPSEDGARTGSPDLGGEMSWD
jgi:DeoR family transcriptional regulator, fructose operon transcriptional repressor